MVMNVFTSSMALMKSRMQLVASQQFLINHKYIINLLCVWVLVNNFNGNKAAALDGRGNNEHDKFLFPFQAASAPNLVCFESPFFAAHLIYKIDISN